MAQPTENSILITALPPATDYMTYLTIIEYNLTRENLPILHDLLQDATLTLNIGWDLVMLLLPLLPESGACLQTVARLGNPREVVLKVTEALRMLDFDGEGRAYGEQISSEEEVDGDEDDTESEAAPQTNAAKREISEQVLLAAHQFNTLLSMLSILHPRIKTKSPSRFLSTSLQAVLASFSGASNHVDLLVWSVQDFLSVIISAKPDSHAPAVPPRTTSNSGDNNVHPSARTVDAQTANPGSQDAAIQQKLLQTFTTHAVQVFAPFLPPMHDVPGYGWSKQVFEKLNPEKVAPGRMTFDELREAAKVFRTRDSAMSRFLELGRQTGLDQSVLLAGALQPHPETTEEDDDHDGGQEEEPPSSADEIPLSSTGCLFMLADSNVRTITQGGNAPDSTVLPIFPALSNLLSTFINPLRNWTAPRDAASSIDALTSLCLIALDANEIGEPTSALDQANEIGEETGSLSEFDHFLRITSGLSADLPDDMIRYYLNYVTSSVLRANPSSSERLHFILHTLKSNDFPNLKVSAVSWIKGETLEAIPPPPPGRTPSPSPNNSVFATTAALRTLFPYLLPDLSATPIVDTSASSEQTWTYFKTNLSFFLGTLNFYYLLFSAPHLRQALKLAELHKEEDVEGRFLEPLRKAVGRMASEGGGGSLGEEEGMDVKMDLMLMEDALDRVARVSSLSDRC